MLRSSICSLLVLLGCLAGCPSAPKTEATVPTPSSSARCAETLPNEEPALGRAAPLEPPLSTLVVNITAPLESLRAQIESQVPVELAAASGIGLGRIGRLSYSVKRGALALRVQSGEIIVDVPISGYASVCVPMGPMCPTVSSCSPGMLVTAVVPLQPDNAYGFHASRVTMAVTRGCVIGGVDATPRFQDAAEGQVAKLKEGIDAVLPSIRPEMEAAWSNLQSPMVAPGTDKICLRAEPERVIAAPGRLEGSDLVFPTAFVTKLRSVQPCEPAAGASSELKPLPPLERVTAIGDDAGLELARATSLGAVQQSLAQATFSKPPEGLPDIRTISLQELKGAQVGAESQMALRIGLEGELCGSAWLLGKPSIDRPSQRLQLREVTLAPGQAASGSRLGRLGLERWLERATERDGAELGADAKLPELFALLREPIERAAQVRAKQAKTVVERADEPITRMLVASDGLITLSKVRGALRVRIE